MFSPPTSPTGTQSSRAKVRTEALSSPFDNDNDTHPRYYTESSISSNTATSLFDIDTSTSTDPNGTTHTSDSSRYYNAYLTPESPYAPTFLREKFENTIDILKGLNLNDNIDNNNNNEDTEAAINGNSLVIPKTYRKTLRITDPSLDQFILRKTIFQVELTDMIGKGSCAYVFKSELYSKFDEDNKLITSVKIPFTVNKAKLILKELQFFKMLKDFWINKWVNSPLAVNNEFPFISLLGVYYINRDEFSLLPRETEVPCLVLENLDMDLEKFVSSIKTHTTGGLIIGKDNFWRLANVLLQSLKCLEEMDCVHCDYKPQNILLNVTEDGKNSITSIKIIDFTSFTELSKIDPSSLEVTLQFSHPDISTRKAIPSIQSELYSIGMILLYAATGSTPLTQTDNKNYLLNMLMELQSGEKSILDMVSPEDKTILNNPDNLREFQLIDTILGQGTHYSQVFQSYL